MVLPHQGIGKMRKTEFANYFFKKKLNLEEILEEYSNMFKHSLVLLSQWLKIRKNWKENPASENKQPKAESEHFKERPRMYIKKTVVRMELFSNHFCTGLESGQLADIGEMLSKVRDLAQSEGLRVLQEMIIHGSKVRKDSGGSRTQNRRPMSCTQVKHLPR